MFECLACALMIKSIYQTSVFYLNITHVMKAFGISYRKAQKLIEWMKEDALFIYNERKNCVFARTLKSNVRYRYGRKRNKKFNALADFCVKIRIGQAYTLRNVICELRNKLLMNAIRNHEHDNLLVGGLSNNVTKQNVKYAMSLRKLARSFGMSKSSAWRYVDLLIKDERVSKSGIVAECVISELNDITEREWFEKHPHKKFKAWHNIENGCWSGWIVYGCIYSVLKCEDAESYKHVIWNHAGRISLPKSDGYYDELDGVGYWEKHCRNQLKKAC